MSHMEICFQNISSFIESQLPTVQKECFPLEKTGSLTMSVRVIAHIAVLIILIMVTPSLSIFERYYDSYDDFSDELWPIDQYDVIYDR